MDLAAALLARTDGIALVGDRRFWVARPQASQLPALLFTSVSSVPDEDLEGEEPDLWTSRVQVEGWARHHEQAWAIAKAASAALLPGAVVGTGGDTIEFELAQRMGPRDLGEADEKGFIHRAVFDMIFRHSAGS
jgi:hypothetical protein